MGGIANEIAKNVPLPPVSLGRMGTKDALRERAKRLLALGVTQKAISDKMGMSRASFNRWMHGEDARVSVDALDGFNAFLSELSQATEQESEQAPALAGETFRPGDRRQHPGGPPAGEPERRKTG